MKNRSINSRINTMVSAAAICATTLAFGINAQAGEHHAITSSTTVTPVNTLTNQENQSLSLAASRVLYHAETAQLALADKKKDEALTQIDQGLKLIKIIKASVPKYKITTSIKAPGESYKSSEQVPQRYVTVLSDAYLEDIIAPVLQSRKSKGGHHKATSNPEEDFSMQGRVIISLDTILAEHMLNQAKSDLKANKLSDADNALTTIKNEGVVFESVSVPQPLAEAADNLYLAKTEMFNGRYHNAYVTLKEASKDLKAYESISGNVRGRDARGLRMKIDTLTAKIDALKDKNETRKIINDAKDDIVSWGHEVRSWFGKQLNR